MPIPLIVIGGAAIAAVTGITGVGKGISSVVKNNEAKAVNRTANETIETAKNRANTAREGSQKSLEVLGKKKLDVLDQSMSRFVEAFSQIKNIQLEGSAELDELSKYTIDKQELAEMKNMSSMATSALGGLVGGVGAGALTALGAYGAAMTFGAASTGTAIAALSGAAASNATLAFFGGGALAAGGLGMAGGTMVLGGLVAGPALAVLGIFMDASASKNRDNAYSNLAKAKEAAESLEVVTTLCNGISKRADLFTALLANLDDRFSHLVSTLEFIIRNSGCDYSMYSESERKEVAMSMALAKAVKQVVDTPILTESGELTQKSKTVYDKISAQYPSIAS